MTKEVKAACKGANKAGVEEIVIKDAHGSGRNIIPYELPENAKIFREWSGHPYKMVDGIDETFDALLFIGYHSYGGSGGNPLAHTMNSSKIDYIKINKNFCSEYLMHAYIAAYLDIPVIFLSGDKEICKEAIKYNEQIVTVATSEGRGGGSLSINPKLAEKIIEQKVRESLEGDLNNKKIELPESFEVEIRYNAHKDAYKNSFYPGVEKIDSKTILFKNDDYFEVLRALSFLI